MKRDTIEKILFSNGRKWFKKLEDNDIQGLMELRLRVHRPWMVRLHNKEYFISESGHMINQEKQAYVITEQDIRETIEFVSNYSLYAFEDEVKHGYITVNGGHRVGLAGKVIVENGQVKTIRNISCINIRITHEIKGCANEVMPYLIQDKTVFHTLIISPPRCGKTTLLRDIVRQVSNGWKDFNGLSVGVVDERSEIGGCYRGVPQNDIGIRTDILDGCPKKEGMLMLLRSMSPDVIVVDEIGSREDIQAIDYIINAGCKIICTVHGGTLKEIQQKPVLENLLRKDTLQRFIILENSLGIGDVKKIYNRNRMLINAQEL